MWIYRSPVGILKIVRQPDGTFGLCHNRNSLGGLATRRRQKPTMFLSCNRL